MEFRSASKPKRTLNTPQEKNIQVVLRCRPRNPQEKRNGSQNAVECNSKKGEVLVRQEIGEKTTTKTFTFDKVYGPDSRQIQIYRGVVEPLIEEVLMGYNCTVFAYGQTGTGKTFTMEGERSLNGSMSWEEDPLAGIIPRALHQLFEKIEAQDVSEFSIRVSFLELYNEELFDLLSPVEDPAIKLRIFEDSARKGSVVVHGLEELQVHSKNEVFSILDRGRSKRQTAATLLNAQSSRSHSVFSVTVHIKESSIEGEELLKTGKLNLVDLAGSENISRSGAVDKRAREAGQINQSLLTLGRVITSLVERAPHVPYRESKLTRILQDSLGGRTKTSIVATIGPSSCNLEETLSTLDYAHRAKNITNRPEINQKLTKKALIKEYTDEIEKLKKDLIATREKNGIFISPENYAGMEALIRSQKEAMVELEARISSNQTEISKLNTLFTTSQTELEETNQQLQETSSRLESTQQHLTSTRRDLHQTRVEKEQNTFLVDQHAHTEKALLGQAGELIGVVEEAIDDVSGLHSKLERKKCVESTNTTATSQFQTVIEGEFEQMKQDLEEFHTIQHTFYQQFTTKIDEWSSVQMTTVHGLQQMVDSIASSVDQAKQAHCTASREQTSLTKCMVNSLQDSTLQFKVSLDSCSNDLLSSMLPLLSGLENQLKLQAEVLSQSTADMNNQLTTHRECVSQFVCDQRQAIQSLSTTIQHENRDHQGALIAQQKSITEALHNQRQLSQSLRTTVLTEVGGLLERVMRQQEEQLGANMALVRVGLRKAADCQQVHTDSLHSALSEMSEDLGKFGSTTTQTTTSMLTSSDATLVKHNQMTKEEDECTQQIHRELESGVANVKKLSNSHTQDHCIELEGVSTSLANHTQQTEDTLSNQLSATQESCSSVHSSICSLTTDAVSQPASQFTQQIASLSSSMQQFCSTQREAVQTAGSIVTTYTTEELAVDVPTGKTPQRREFSYPQQLVRTRPHSDLLRDFQPSAAALLELPESDTESEAEKTSPAITANSVPVPRLDLSPDSSEMELLETTTTSVDTNSSLLKTSITSELHLSSDEHTRKENNSHNTTSTHPTTSSKIPTHSGSKRGQAGRMAGSSNGKKRPLSVKN